MFGLMSHVSTFNFQDFTQPILTNFEDGDGANSDRVSISITTSDSFVAS